MFITVGDAQLYTTAFGPTATPAIVGIGGWIGSWELWAEPFTHLSQQWRTIAYDHRGTGATLAPARSITFETLVDDLMAVLDAYHVEQCMLAAESAGAQTALSAALKHPDRIAALVIVDGMYYRPTPPAQDRFLLGLQTAYAATLDWFVETCVPEADCTHIKSWGRQILNRSTQEAAIALYRTASEIDLRPSLHQITQPTLILHGAADLLVPIEAARWLAQTLPRTHFMLLPDAGHVPTLTRPRIVAQEMQRFLASVAG